MSKVTNFIVVVLVAAVLISVGYVYLKNSPLSGGLTSATSTVNGASTSPATTTIKFPVAVPPALQTKLANGGGPGNYYASESQLNATLESKGNGYSVSFCDNTFQTSFSFCNATSTNLLKHAGQNLTLGGAVWDVKYNSTAGSFSEFVMLGSNATTAKREYDHFVSFQGAPHMNASTQRNSVMNATYGNSTYSAFLSNAVSGGYATAIVVLCRKQITYITMESPNYSTARAVALVSMANSDMS